MRDRVISLEAKIDTLAETQRDIRDTLKSMERTFILNEDNRARIDELAERQDKMHYYLQSRWYVIVTVASSLAAAISIAFQLI